MKNQKHNNYIESCWNEVEKNTDSSTPPHAHTYPTQNKKTLTITLVIVLCILLYIQRLYSKSQSESQRAKDFTVLYYDILQSEAYYISSFNQMHYENMTHVNEDDAEKCINLLTEWENLTIEHRKSIDEYSVQQIPNFIESYKSLVSLIDSSYDFINRVQINDLETAKTLHKEIMYNYEISSDVIKLGLDRCVKQSMLTYDVNEETEDIIMHWNNVK